MSGLDNVQNADICDNYPLVKPEEKPSVIADTGGGGGAKIKDDSLCVLTKDGRWCSIRDCQARMVSSSTMKWRYCPSRNDYGYVSVKVKNIICSNGKRKPVIPPSTTNSGTKCEESNYSTQYMMYSVVEGMVGDIGISDSSESTPGRRSSG